MIIGSESELIEFKLTTEEKKEAMEAIAAMLNKHNKGTIYFGVDDNGYVRGQTITDSTKKDISRLISESIEPKISPTIEVIKVEDKEVLKVTFAGHNRPYSVNGKYLIRVGTENRKMGQEDLIRLIKHDDYSSKWEDELTDYGLDDLDDEALLDFYESAKACGRLEMNVYNKEKLLSNLDLMKEGKAKNGCYALFGKNAKIALKLASFATDNKVTFTDLKLLNGNIYNLISAAIKYVRDNIKWKPEIGARKRVEVPEIPEMAIREIIVNAFAHCDYEVVPEIEVGIHPGFIEIYNPGSFPEELTPYDFIRRNLPSYKRNKLILDILFRSKDVEKSGTGFQRVNELCEKADISWSFRKEAYGFYSEFIRHNGNASKIKKDDESSNKLEKKTYELLEEEEGITKNEIALRLNRSERTIQRFINSLISKGLVERVGSNKKGYWRVKE